MIKIQKHFFCLINVGRIGKFASTKAFFFSFYSDILKFCPNCPIGYEDTNSWEKNTVNLYDAYLFKIYSKCQKKFIRKIVFVFNLTSVYQILCNFIYWMNSCKYFIYSLPPSPFRPLFMAPASVRVWISHEAIFFLNK